jgi:hypothetical protein
MATTELTKADRETKAQIKIGHYVLRDTLGIYILCIITDKFSSIAYLGVGTFGKVKGIKFFVNKLQIR